MERERVTLAAVARCTSQMQEQPRSLRARGQVWPIVGVVLVVLMTLGNAAANMLPGHHVSAAERRRAEQDEMVAQRRARITELRQIVGGCRPAISHELARLLVMDGQWSEARGYAEGYELRCGPDPVVHHWGNAPVPRARR